MMLGAGMNEGLPYAWAMNRECQMWKSNLSSTSLAVVTRTWFAIVALSLPTLAQQNVSEVASGRSIDGGSQRAAVHSDSVVDVSDVSGVDCTGISDSSPALNHLFDARQSGNINGKHVIIPSTCQLRADHPITVFGQSSFVMDGEGDRK